MKIIILLIALFANPFSVQKSYALDVNDYYQNTNSDYFYFFLKKLFKDPEFETLQKQIKKNPNFENFFEIWLKQVDCWSFDKDKKTIYMFQVVYQIQGNLRVPKSITLNFKNNNDLKKALKVSGLNVFQNEQDIGVNLNFSNGRIISGKPLLLNSLEIQKFEEFPYYLFIKRNSLFEFFFRKWRIPVDKLIFKEDQPWGFVIP
jgi:hypothetical protein